jgi:hypothetical protein
VKDAAGNTINAGKRKAANAADATTQAAGEAAGYVAGTGEAVKDAAGNTINAGKYKAGQAADATQDAAAAAAHEAGGVFNTLKNKVFGTAEAAKVHTAKMFFTDNVVLMLFVLVLHDADVIGDSAAGIIHCCMPCTTTLTATTTSTNTHHCYYNCYCNNRRASRTQQHKHSAQPATLQARHSALVARQLTPPSRLPLTH